MKTRIPLRPVHGKVVAVATVALLVSGAPLTAQAASYPSDTDTPDLVSLLTGFDDYWASDGNSDLHGTVLDVDTLSFNDELTVWINNNATAQQQFRALQDSSYNNSDGTAYDQSFTVSEGLGDVLSAIYVQGLEDGSLPLTQALINSSDGTSGAYVSTSTAKATFSYPRPFLSVDPDAAAVDGDDEACDPSNVNGSSLASIRAGQDYADADGNLNIVRVAATTDTTHQFSDEDVALDASYGTSGLCTGGSYPSGHTTTAYEAGITLATLVPELGTEVLARASENGNNRIVLGVHYPLDIMGGRIDGEAALAARWSDEEYRTDVLEPARAELIAYLEAQCGATVTECAASGAAYTDDPYGGEAIPGGTSQIVTDRASALAVYTERLTYGFDQTGTAGLAASVPDGAENLLLTAFPTLTDDQRTSVLAQTEIDSGYPLDLTSDGDGSWERLNLAAAMSATVQLNNDGTVTVLSVGGAAEVVAPQGTLTAPEGGSVAAGGTIQIAGSGFAADATLSLVLHSDPVTVSTVTTDANGDFATTVTIPSGTASGAHTLEALYSDGTTASAAALALTVTAASSTTHLPVVSG
ncbi:MAG: phosphatase PAP2 family protein [Microbacterium sp.]